MIAFLAFILPFGLYISLPSSMWNFDGVACAIALEMGGSFYLFHSNHLLYGFLGSLFWRFLGMSMGFSRALPALQFFTSLLSALGLLGLYRLLNRQMRNPWLALGITLCMALTAAFWVWSIEAQVYALGFLGLAWATRELLENWTPQKYVKVALWHGLAILGHVMHIVWVLPVLYWIHKEKPPAYHRKSYKTYLGWLAPTVAIPYLVVLVFVIARASSGSRERIWIWLKGSAALTANRHWQWHTPGWDSPLIWCSTTLSFLWGTLWPYASIAPGRMLWGITGVSALAFLIILALAFRSEDHKVLRTFSLLWIGTAALFLWTWEPETICYRMSEIIPLALLTAIGLQSLKKPFAQWGLLLILLASTGTVNCMTEAYPMSQASHNTLYEQALTLSKTTPDNSLYITGGGAPWIYILYFTGRSSWNVHLLTPERLSDNVARYRRGGPVFIQSGLLEDTTLRPIFSVYKLKPVAPDLPWLQLE